MSWLRSASIGSAPLTSVQWVLLPPVQHAPRPQILPRARVATHGEQGWIMRVRNLHEQGWNAAVSNTTVLHDPTLRTQPVALVQPTNPQLKGMVYTRRFRTVYCI